jgi:uncharacterized protein
MIEKRFINIEDPEVETRSETAEDGKRYIMGYFSLANSPSVQITERINGNLVTFTETIDPRAFQDADLSSVIYNVEHNNARPIARTGANLELKVTERGLFARAEIPAERDATTEQNDLLKYIDQRIIRANSFAFTVAEGGDEWQRRDGQLFRNINRIKRVFDITSTTSPAYPDTFVFTRSLDESQIHEVKPGAEQPKNEIDVIDLEFLILKSKVF